MSDLIKKAREKLAFDDRAKTLESEFRYACYPDADKDELQTLLADYACHGFASGVGVKFDRIKPIIDALLKVAEAAENSGHGPHPVGYCIICDALAELSQAVGDR